MRRTYVIVALAAVALSWLGLHASRPSVRLSRAIDRCLSSGSSGEDLCQVSLTDFVGSNWDEVAVVQGNESVPVTSGEIQRDWGFATPDDVPLNTIRLFFLRAGAVVETVDLSRYEPTLSFEPCDGSTYPRVSRPDAVFRTVRSSRGDVFLYPACAALPREAAGG